MAGVFDIELDPSNPEGDDVSDEDAIEIKEDHVQVSYFFPTTSLTVMQCKFEFTLHN